MSHNYILSSTFEHYSLFYFTVQLLNAILINMKSDELYLKLLRKINNDPQISQRDLSKEFDTSLGKINYCLKALRSKGLIKIKNFQKSKDKIKYLYILTPKGIVEKTKITMRFMHLKMREYDELKAELKSKKKH